MSARELLQAMCPLGVFDHWSGEDVSSQLLMMLRQTAHKRIVLGPYWRN